MKAHERKLTVLVFVLIAFLSCACARNTQGNRVPPEVESTISQIGDDIAQERYEQVYNEASELWRKDATLDQSTQVLKTLRDKLGKVETRSLHSATEQQNSGGALKGHAFIVSYETKFQHGEGMETFTLIEQNGQWLLARYLVNSTALR